MRELSLIRQGLDGAGLARPDVVGIDNVLLDQLPESVAVCTSGGVCVYVNPALERAYGRPRADLLGRVLWELFPEVLGPAFQERFHRVSATGAAEEFECPYPARERWFVQRLLPPYPLHLEVQCHPHGSRRTLRHRRTIGRCRTTTPP